MVKHINAEELERLLKEHRYVVCDFWATWCGPCRMLAPVYEEASEKFKDKAVFVKIDIDETDENGATAATLGVSSIPSVFVFENGEVKDNHLGFVPASVLEEFLNKNIR